MVVVAKGYRVVPQRLAEGGQGFRQLHLKEHRGSFKAPVSAKDGKNSKQRVFAKGCTLFVGNVDDQGGRLCRKTIEDRLRRALTSCGDIAHVHASYPTEDPTSTATSSATNAPSKAAGKRAIGSARYAHVCFSSSVGVQKALTLDSLSSGALEVAIKTGDDGSKGLDTECRDENGDETCGYSALIQRHRRGFPPREALQAEVDTAMQRFESEEAREAAERKARLENPEGDDGFVTVTYKRKRGRNSGNPAEGEGVRTDGGAKKKKKGAGELQDFYRFQMRETRREQLVSLRSKFEQDKARVAKMKEQRKFRPF